VTVQPRLDISEDLCTAALAQAPFAVLIFRPDADLTLVWRNRAHEQMSRSLGRDVIGLPMFEAFPPNEEDGGDAAVAALRKAAQDLRNGAGTVDIGPYRFDLPDARGAYVEHHWQIRMSPIMQDGRVTAILQVAQDVTQKLLSQQLAETQKRATHFAIGASYFVYDPHTDLFLRGAEIDALFGFAPGEAGDHGAPFFERVAPEHLEAVHAEVARVFASPRGEVASFDYRIQLPDGAARFVRIRGEIATDPVDRRPKLVGTFIDLTDIEENRQKLESLVEMKDALLAEANHRIKNSLQMALSMLRLERADLRRNEDATVESAVDVLSVAEARIRSVAAIHGMMRLNENAARVDLDDLVGDLLRNTRQTVGMKDSEMVLQGPSFGAHLDSDGAIALGLIVNELLTNAVKYGWADAVDGVIEATRGRDGSTATLVIENGIRSAEERDIVIPSSGLGGDLVEGFLDQISGEITREATEDRYRVTLRFAVNA
jgi:two-component sensor histidine kinase